MAYTGKITRKQEQAIAALLQSPTVAEAARAAQVGERTLWRWLRDPHFKAAYQVARREVVSQAVGHLQRTATAAAEALARIMNDREAAASARVSAARTILELSLKAIEIEELEARIAALEELAEGGGDDESAAAY